MNRQQRRKLLANLKSQGFSQKQIDYILRNFDADVKPLEDGDRVTLKVDQIMGHPSYPTYSQQYRDFVEGNRDTVFTVMIEEKRREQLYPPICFLEDAKDPQWLFIQSDVTKINREEGSHV